MEKNNINSIELWEKLYGNKEHAFDFAKKLMLKSEYKSENEFGWDVDLYDESDDQYYIANCSSIKARNNKPVFEIEDTKYIVAKNPNSTYSIINPIEINDLTNPINIDLYIMNAINNHKIMDNIYVKIKLKKLKDDYVTIFIDIVEDFLNASFKKIKLQFNNKSELRDELVLSISNSKNDLQSFMKAILIIDSIINLLLFRLKQVYGNDIWINDDEDKSFYNILILDSINLNDFIFAFDNKILLSGNIKKLLIENGFDKNEFKIFNELDNQIFYEYPFINSDYNFYFSKITRKK